MTGVEIPCAYNQPRPCFPLSKVERYKLLFLRLMTAIPFIPIYFIHSTSLNNSTTNRYLTHSEAAQFLVLSEGRLNEKGLIEFWSVRRYLSAILALVYPTV